MDASAADAAADDDTFEMIKARVLQRFEDLALRSVSWLDLLVNPVTNPEKNTLIFGSVRIDFWAQDPAAVMIVIPANEHDDYMFEVRILHMLFQQQSGILDNLKRSLQQNPKLATRIVLGDVFYEPTQTFEIGNLAVISEYAPDAVKEIRIRNGLWTPQVLERVIYRFPNLARIKIENVRNRKAWNHPGTYYKSVLESLKILFNTITNSNTIAPVITIEAFVDVRVEALLARYNTWRYNKLVAYSLLAFQSAGTISDTSSASRTQAGRFVDRDGDFAVMRNVRRFLLPGMEDAR